MARLPRIRLAGIPQHVVQRGNNRRPCFLTEADRLRYLHTLREVAIARKCAIHAYVLMTNHVHLLVTPAAADGVSHMMQALGRRYVAYFNTMHRRTGTLWEGRFKASLVDSERYLLACYCYIEMNPVRAAMVAEPGEYRWSSHGCNAEGKADPLVTPHPQFLALGNTDEDRRRSYRALVHESIGDDELHSIREHLQQQRAFGSTRFQAEIGAVTGRCVTLRPRGRPAHRLEK